MDRVYQSNAIETPPSTVASSGSYPTAGNKASGQRATVPGPYWFYSITEEIRNAIIAAGVTPDSAKVNQLASAIAKHLPLTGGTLTGPVWFGVTDAQLLKVGSDGRFIIRGGASSVDCASLYLNANNMGSDKWNGTFNLQVANADVTHRLVGYLDGRLQWDGKNILRTINGESATNDGDVKFTLGKCEEYGTYSGVDLNTFVKAGVYAVKSGSTELNFPNGSNGILVVYEAPNTSAGGTFVRQVYYRIGTVGGNDYNIFTRQIDYNPTSGSTFGPWVRDIYLIDSWRSGANFYRKYSDGYIEQGGFVSNTASSGTITFNTPFSSANYMFVGQDVVGSTTDTGGAQDGVFFSNRTTTTVRFSSNGRSLCWYASGF